MAKGGSQEDKAEKKDPFDSAQGRPFEKKEDLFDATGGLKGGYDLGMARMETSW